MGITEGSPFAISEVEWLNKNSWQSGWFRTSGSTLWSRSTKSEFGSILHEGLALKFISAQHSSLHTRAITFCQKTHKSRFCEMCSRKEPTLQNSKHCETWFLLYQYENGASLLNLKMTWIHMALARQAQTDFLWDEVEYEMDGCLQRRR